MLASPPASASKPHELFQGPYLLKPSPVAPDGRFLVLGLDELLKRRFATPE